MASARDRVLDAYETLLIEVGAAAATLDAVAAAAGVSKGGLLYHFASKDALAEGLLGRLRERSTADADAIRATEEGAAAYYLRTSAPGGGLPGGLTRTYLAALRAVDHMRDGLACAPPWPRSTRTRSGPCATGWTTRCSRGWCSWSVTGSTCGR